MAQNFSLDVIKHTRKFDGKEFTTWKHNMEMLFTLKNVKLIVDGQLTEPEVEFDDDDPSIMLNGDDIEQWKMSDCYARYLIFNSCDEIRKQALLNSRTSHEMWTRLETQYLQRAADNKHLLHREFLNLRPKPNEDIIIHITALESMATELNDLGVNVTEHDLITTIMCSLPSRFGFLSSCWDNVPDNERSMDALRARIVSEQRRIELRKTEEEGFKPLTNTPEGTALQAYGGQKGHFPRAFRGSRGRGGASRDTIIRDTAKCTYCGKPHHYEFECRTRIANEGDKQTTSFKRANNDGDGSGPSRKADFSFISVYYLTTTDPDALYLDSGATRHMSGVHSYFQELRDIPPNSWPINGIGGTVLHTKGVGTIKLSSHVHGETINRNLKDVLYVPGLGVNLISVVCLSNNGYTVSFHGLEACIMRDNTVIMTASRSGETLYKVNAVVSTPSTMGLAVATTQATLNTWHERLGHVNRRTVLRMASGIGVTGMDISPKSTTLNECRRW